MVLGGLAVCADCHAPGIEGKAGGRDLHDPVGIAFESGNHCDVCHKARDHVVGQAAQDVLLD